MLGPPPQATEGKDGGHGRRSRREWVLIRIWNLSGYNYCESASDTLSYGGRGSVASNVLL